MVHLAKRGAQEIHSKPLVFNTPQSEISDAARSPSRVCLRQRCEKHDPGHHESLPVFLSHHSIGIRFLLKIVYMVLLPGHLIRFPLTKLNPGSGLTGLLHWFACR